MSINAIGSLSSLSGSNSIQQTDPSQMMNTMIQQFLQKYDANGDGSLSSQEIPGLSSSAFQALTNGSGQLTSSDIQTAMQKFQTEMKQAMSSNDPQQAMSALKNTPEGQLMQLMRASHHHKGQDQGQDQASSPIQITVNQTIFNIGQSQSSSTGLDVNA